MASYRVSFVYFRFLARGVRTKDRHLESCVIGSPENFNED